MAFKGMNPDEGRTVAEAITKAGEQIQETYEQLTSLVTSVEWVGPDYDTFTSDWNSFISGNVASVVDGFTQFGQNLTQQAEAQDETSNQS